jgi:hypothetical protein
VAASWQPRLGYAGTYEATWKKKRAPYLPEDVSPKYFQAAHEELVAPSYLLARRPPLRQAVLRLERHVSR